MNGTGNQQYISAEAVPKKFADHSINDTWGYTYFVRVGDLIKIGHSGAPKQRITSLGRDREILAVVPNTIISEGDAHKKFAHLREVGEKFRIAPDLLDFIEEVKVLGAAVPRVSEPPPPRDPALAKTMSELTVLRNQHKADTAIGHHCSNIMRLIQMPNPPAHLVNIQMAGLQRALREFQ